MIDLGERAVLSVLVQRGGKLPEWKKMPPAWLIASIPRSTPFPDGTAEIFHDEDGTLLFAEIYDRPCLVRQFNSATIGDLVGRGYARRRVDRVRRVRIVEITDAGRKALAGFHE